MTADGARRPTVAPSRRAHVAGWLLGGAGALVVVYAAWRGYQSPDFLIGVAAAFGLC
jgi:hypothetical protein